MGINRILNQNYTYNRGPKNGVSSISKYNKMTPNSSTLKHSNMGKYNYISFPANSTHHKDFSMQNISITNKPNASFNIQHINDTPTKPIIKDDSRPNLHSNKKASINTSIIKEDVDILSDSTNNSLEEVFKRQNRPDPLFIKINFVVKKIGDAQTLNVLRFLDKYNGQLTQEEVMEKLENIVGKASLHGISKTLVAIFKISSYKFR